MHCHVRLRFKLMLNEIQMARQGEERICKRVLQYSNIYSLGLYEMFITMKGGMKVGIWHLWANSSLAFTRLIRKAVLSSHHTFRLR